MTAAKLTRLGPYQLIAELPHGAQLAKMDGPGGTKKLVVVKELRAESVGSRELRQLTRLTHPNLVRTMGTHEDHGKLYIATEYIDGQPWSRVRGILEQSDSLSTALQLQVLLEVLSALDYAHALSDPDDPSSQLVHGAVSPRSVMITYHGLVKLVDFGVARAVIDGSSVADKLACSAPEQTRGDASDRRADIFSVGVMLWEALTDRPFAQSQDETELRRLRGAGLEPRVRAIVPDAPPKLADICDRALALAPEDRYATAAELRAALVDHLGEDVRESDRAHLGKLVQAAFQEDRARLHSVLDQQLRSRKPTANVRVHAAIARRPTTAPLAVSPAVSPSLDPRIYAAWVLTRLRKDVSLRELRRGRVPLLVISVALLSFGITWLASRPEPQAVAPVAPVAPRAPKPKSAALAKQEAVPQPEAATQTSLHAATDLQRVPPTSSVLLTITARPASAELFLDGTPVSDNPFSVRVAADHQLHTVRASGSGLAAEERTVRFDRDQVIALELEHARVARTGSVVSRPAHSAARPSTASPEKPAASPLETSGAVRQRARSGDMFDATLVVGKTARPIYEDDPYPGTPSR